MQRTQFLQLLQERILILDGGYGTEFFKRGYGQIPGVLLNLHNPEAVEHLHREYIHAGADIILANTFSANRPKLKSLGLETHFLEINTRAVQIARKAAGVQTLVFGNLSSIGEFPMPIGLMEYEDSVHAFSEQAEVLLEAGVDGFIIETITDLKELKAAVLGIREKTVDLPIVAQMTFDQSLQTITGTSAKIFATTFEDLDVDVLGLNCSLGPEEMFTVFQELASYTTKPLSIEPNAGKPLYDGVNLIYNTLPEHFAIHIESFVDLGANIIGGCCGTSPDHIKTISKLLNKRRPLNRSTVYTQALTSRTIYKQVEPFAIIGERINPASRKSFQEEIVQGNYQTLIKEALTQEKEGATLVDLNLGIEKLLTPEHFTTVIREMDRHSSLPISFDIQTSLYLEKALREYPGRPLINSAQVTEKSLEHRIRLLKNYGGMLILLAMSNTIPETALERYAIILEGIKILEENGISRKRILADPLILSLGAKNDPRVALETIHLLSKAGIKTTMGLSNLSFGLPQRSRINGAYLAQAIDRGLTSAIMNTADLFVIDSLHGALTIKGVNIIEKTPVITDNLLVEVLLAGDAVQLKHIIVKELRNLSPVEVSQNILGKALEEIGDMYSAGKIYLPHLLLAAETAQPIFDYLNTLTTEKRTYRGKVVLATVEGDVHTIGKNIVGTVLKSGGFQVIDAGKDVTVTDILEVLKREKPDILGLSAMMTTTAGRVKDMSELLKQEKLPIKLITGGASMNALLAQQFGCDGYAENASMTLKLCNELMTHRNCTKIKEKQTNT